MSPRSIGEPARAAPQVFIPAPAVAKGLDAPTLALAMISVGAVMYATMAGFYNRVTRERTALHPLRKQILVLLQREPGLRRAEIARRLSVHFTTIEHHLRILERYRLIESHRRGSGARFFAGGHAADPGARERAILLRHPRIQSFLQVALPLESFDAAEIARRLGIPRSTGARHARWLVEARILRRIQDRLSFAPEALSLLREQDVGGAGRSERLPPASLPSSPWPSARSDWANSVVAVPTGSTGRLDLSP